MYILKHKVVIHRRCNNYDKQAANFAIFNFHFYWVKQTHRLYKPLK